MAEEYIIGSNAQFNDSVEILKDLTLYGVVENTTDFAVKIQGDEKLRITSDGITFTDTLTALSVTAPSGIFSGIITATNVSVAQSVTAIEYYGTFKGSIDPSVANDKISEGNSSAEVVDTGSDGHFKVITEGDERLRITSTGNVGINTITPRSKLHILEGGSGFDYGSISGDLIVEDSDDANIQLLSPSTQSGHIMFGDESNGVVGRIKYEHTHNSMRFYTSNLERMAIASDGNVGIGTTVANSKLDVRGAILANCSFYQEQAGVTRGSDAQDKTVHLAGRGVFLMLISYSLGTTTTEVSRNVYSLGLFTSRSNGATWTAIQQDLTSSHVGDLTISDANASGKLRVQKSSGSDARACAFRIDVLSSANVQITVTDT